MKNPMTAPTNTAVSHPAEMYRAVLRESSGRVRNHKIVYSLDGMADRSEGRTDLDDVDYQVNCHEGWS